MVKEIKDNDATIYQCEICEMGYSEQETAERCEEYCNTHESCSIDITKNAIYKPPAHFMP